MTTIPIWQQHDQRLEEIVQRELRPYIHSIDAEAFYPRSYLLSLGKEGYLKSNGKLEARADARVRGVLLVEETAACCMTTAFNLWCHLALITYLRLSDNDRLKRTWLDPLESGALLGGTGLSNPMKYYAGLDRLYLKATRVTGGYCINGQLPMVSNLGADHCFAIIAEADGRRIMAIASCRLEGISLTERIGFLGMNGSATYTCRFEGVLVPDEAVISEQADEYIVQVRPTFVLYQIPLGLGVASASIRSIRQASGRQGGSNRYLPVQADQLEAELHRLRSATYLLAEQPDLGSWWKELLQLRRDIAYLTLEAVQACMLHQGSAGYAQHSGPARRLREAYFLANLTPTVRHLEKLLAT